MDAISIELPSRILVQQPQKLHPYSFAINNPVAFTDSTGLEPIPLSELFKVEQANQTPVGNWVQGKADWYFNMAMKSADRGGNGLDHAVAIIAIGVGSIIEGAKNLLGVETLEKGIRTVLTPTSSSGQKLSAGARVGYEVFGGRILSGLTKLHHVLKFPSVRAFEKGPVKEWLGKVVTWMKGDLATSRACSNGAASFLKQMRSHASSM